jgi:hypothetical protein
LQTTAVPDFGSDRKATIFTNPAQINSGQNVAGFRFWAGFAKWRVQLLQRFIFELFSFALMKVSSANVQHVAYWLRAENLWTNLNTRQLRAVALVYYFKQFH